MQNLQILGHEEGKLFNSLEASYGQEKSRIGISLS